MTRNMTHLHDTLARRIARGSASARDLALLDSLLVGQSRCGVALGMCAGFLMQVVMMVFWFAL